MTTNFDFSHKSFHPWGFPNPNCPSLDSGRLTDGSAVRKKLEAEIERNKSYGRELGVENLQLLHAERSLLIRENELLKEQEEGIAAETGLY